MGRCARVRRIAFRKHRTRLELLRERAIFVALATGRLQMNAVRLIAPYGITSMVADGGNSVTIEGRLRWMEGMPLFRMPAPAALARRTRVAGRSW